MNANLAAALQLLFLLALLAALYVPLGDYMARVYSSTKDLAVERVFYRLVRVDSRSSQSWSSYAAAVLGFSLAGVAFLYLLQRLQGVLPWSGGRSGVSPSVAFNTAISFVTNTNWQSYSPEEVMSNLSQTAGLTVQNFVSAAVGMSVAIALIRGIVAATGDGRLGNFWVDLTRSVLRILLPLSIIIALILLTQGVVQTWSSGFSFTNLDGSAGHAVTGQLASQEAIKELGTNGGGSLNANSAHPFENPTPLSNLVEIFALLLIPVCLTRTYSTLVGDRRQGLTILAVMASLWGLMLTVVWWSESAASGVAGTAAGAMMEGKEQRFGIPASALFAVSTTGTSTGAVNSMHDSYSALGGGALMWNMLLGEVAPGGVGSGMYGMLVLAIIAVFIGGLLVGRTPLFLGKRIGQQEITMAMASVLIMPALVLTGAGISAILSSTPEHQGNSGPAGSPDAIHGFSEIVYAYASAANNNGSAFAGLTVTSDWFQISLGLAMLFGRFLPIIFVLALAGSLAHQRPKPVATGAGAQSALPTHGILYGALLLGTVALIAGLTFFPALSLGPIAEALA